MKEQDFTQIRQYLRAMYREIISTPAEIEAWNESLRPYGYDEIKAAAISYYNGPKGKYAPKPYELIELLPKAEKTNFVPRYETVNGKRVSVFSCLRCRDTGLITWTGADGAVYGKSCRCEAGRIRYPWPHLPLEQQEEYVRKHGHHGEIVGERC